MTKKAPVFFWTIAKLLSSTVDLSRYGCQYVWLIPEDTVAVFLKRLFIHNQNLFSPTFSDVVFFCSGVPFCRPTLLSRHLNSS